MQAISLSIKHPATLIDGYPAFVRDVTTDWCDTTTPEYAREQTRINASKTLNYVLPIIRSNGASSVLDVGCGVGEMVRTLLDNGCNAYGVDLACLPQFWRERKNPVNRFFVIDPAGFELPFFDGAVDFAYSFGVIEHVGTSDGHSDRLPDYHQLRRQWLREVFRVVRPGGKLLIGGPNRKFPLDVAHGPDSRTGRVELALSRWAKCSVHKTWGEHFLWAYSDFPKYLDGLSYVLTPLSIAQFLNFSRVPPIIQSAAMLYARRLPQRLLGTGFNPWVMALITKI